VTTDVIRGTARLGAAFIGGGFMATVHSRAARAARAELRAGTSSTAERGRRAAADLGLDVAYPSLDDLLADPEVDVVHICTPNATHAELARAVLDAGKHVICEKPLATNVADAHDLVERAASAGRVATVPFVYRYHPMVREARDRVARGDTGALLGFTGSYLQDWLLDDADDDWRVDTGLGGPSRAFADIGSHLCDLLEFVTGDRIARLAATTRTVFRERAEHRDIRTEDLVGLVAETATGAIGTLTVSQVAPGRKNRLAIEIAGSRESLGFDQEDPELLWVGRRDGDLVLRRDARILSADAARLSTVPAGHPMGYQDAFNAFVDDTYALVLGEQRDGVPTFADGLRAAQLTDAVLRSAAERSWVELPAVTR
jgi:predicted dehydrogenase